jgi:integrase
VISRRGNGYWEYNFRFTLKHADGEKEHFRIRQSAKTNSKAKAKDVEAAHRLALRMGQCHPNDPWPAPIASTHTPTLRAFAPEFLQHVKTNRKSGTLRFYKGGLGRLLNFTALADVALDKITIRDVDNYSRYRLEVAKNDPVTVNGDLRTLRRLRKLAVKWGRLKADDAVAINEIPEAPGTRRAFTPKEEQLYLRHASRNLADAAILSCDSGLRPEELLPLPWANVDLASRPETPNGVVHVRGEGKSPAAIRSVPLTPRAQEVLQRRWKAVEAGIGKPSFVFAGSGKTGHIVSMQHPHEQAIKKAKLESLEFYCWRHTFGTRAAMAGVDKFALCKLMGHSSPAVTEKYYVHVTTEHVAHGFEKFVAYSERGTAEGIAAAFPPATDAVQ